MENEENNQQNNGNTNDDNSSSLTVDETITKSNAAGQSGAQSSFISSIKIPAHNLDFNEEYFIELLAGSISLKKEEKWHIVQSIPKLSQKQVDELIAIFEEEKQKFAELNKKYDNKLDSLADKHKDEWTKLETESEQLVKKEEDDKKADAIRASLADL